MAPREIAEARLIRPLREALPVWQQSLWLVCPHSTNRRKARRFVEWLQGTLHDLPMQDRPQDGETRPMAAQAAP